MNDQRYMPYFKDCIGCIDGTHIGACILENQQGSTHDTRVFLHALNTSSSNFPKPPRGKYYLVDKGYPDRNGYLVPYSKTRYHQSQFENEPPNNKQEAFNRKHSSLRSYIERSFGVLKKRWKILDYIPQDELHDVRNHDTNNGDNSGGASNEMKQIRNDIATLIWNARHE
ncbi:ALP1-like protein isoform X2 [Tanacetum coccineum]